MFVGVFLLLRSFFLTSHPSAHIFLTMWVDGWEVREYESGAFVMVADASGKPKQSRINKVYVERHGGDVTAAFRDYIKDNVHIYDLGIHISYTWGLRSRFGGPEDHIQIVSVVVVLRVEVSGVMRFGHLRWCRSARHNHRVMRPCFRAEALTRQKCGR